MTKSQHDPTNPNGISIVTNNKRGSGLLYTVPILLIGACRANGPDDIFAGDAITFL